jgi:AcrR family transcriptional regulator
LEIDVTPQPDAVQQQLIDARRAQILDAASQVFAAKGFHRATIKEIAGAAGVADGTIYNYFANKDDLLMGLLDRLNETDTRASDLASTLSADDFKAFLTAYLRHRIELIWPNTEVFRAVLPEVMVNAQLRHQYYTEVVAPTLQLAETYFQQSMEQGTLRRLDPALTVRALAGSILGLLLLRILGDEPVTQRSQELPDLLATLLWEGLRPDLDAGES